MKELIEKLTAAYGPVGFEDEIRSIVRAEIAPFADEVSVNRLGSLIAVKRGYGRGVRRKIMLVAHLDEIGLMVTHIDQRGYARVTQLGAVFPVISTGQRVRFADGRAGIVDVERRDDASKAPSLDQLYIDVGAADKAACPVKVGDVACFNGAVEQVGNRLVAKSLDDRLGCAILIETARRLKTTPHDVYFVFSVQEETTSAGARTAAYSIEPDVALAIDVTATGDTPKARPMAVELGKGPAIKVQDARMLADLRVRAWLVQRATEARIPYQLEILRDGTTDAEVIQASRGGVLAGGVLVPCRHIHSPSEMIDLSDAENAVKLLLAALKKPLVMNDE